MANGEGGGAEDVGWAALSIAGLQLRNIAEAPIGKPYFYR